MYYSTILLLSYLLIILIIQSTKATTEWFGDKRAHMNPQQQPPFYDIVYDESECPFGLESIAIPEYVYFGEMIAAKSVKEHSLCLQFCLENTRCKAVNYFETIGGKKEAKTGFCELLVETQYDNPRLMRPFKKATYYEKIKCRTEGEEVQAEQEKQQPSSQFEFDSNKGIPSTQQQQNSNERRLLQQQENKSRENNSGKKISSKEVERHQTQENERKLALKKLSKKIHDFSLFLKSR